MPNFKSPMLSPRKLGLRSAPPNLNQWEEGDDEDYDDVDEDLDEDQYGNSTDLTSPVLRCLVTLLLGRGASTMAMG